MEDQEFLDEPLSNDPDATGPDDWHYLDHIYTSNLPETREEVLKPFYNLIKNYSAGDGYDRHYSWL